MNSPLAVLEKFEIHHRAFWTKFSRKVRQVLDTLDRIVPEWTTTFVQLQASFDPAAFERTAAESFLQTDRSVPPYVVKLFRQAYETAREPPLCEIGHERSDAQKQARQAALDFLRLTTTAFHHCWTRRPLAKVYSFRDFSEKKLAHRSGR